MSTDTALINDKGVTPHGGRASNRALPDRLQNAILWLSLIRKDATTPTVEPRYSPKCVVRSAHTFLHEALRGAIPTSCWLESAYTGPVLLHTKILKRPLLDNNPSVSDKRVLNGLFSAVLRP